MPRRHGDHQRFWTADEVAILRRGWGRVRVAVLMERLPGRTSNMIIGKADRLGLRRITWATSTRVRFHRQAVAAHMAR